MQELQCRRSENNNTKYLLAVTLISELTSDCASFSYSCKTVKQFINHTEVQPLHKQSALNQLNIFALKMADKFGKHNNTNSQTEKY
jgi:hypothetical protein